MIIKIKKFFLFLVLIFIIYPRYVIADSDIEFKCYDEIMIGNNLECEFNLINPNYDVKGIQFKYEFDDDFSYLKTNINKIWDSPTSNSDGVVILNLDGIRENKEIGIVNFLVSNDVILKKNYEFKLMNIRISDGEKDFNISDKIFKVKVLSISDVLESISINNDTLEIKDGRTEYSIEVSNDVSSVEIKSKLKNNKYYYVENYGPRVYENLKVGDNNIQLKIRNDDIELITYNINVKRLEKGITSNKDNENKEDITINNPKTGGKFILIVILILILSFISILIFNKKIEKEK